MERNLKAIESKISQAEKQLQEARKELEVYRKTQKLLVPKIGGTVEIMGMKWIVLDKTENGYLCLAERLKDNMRFDSSCNDWKSSSLRNYLNTEFYKKLANEIGEENIIPFERDLISLDGQTEYGTCEDKVSLISVDEYRKYRALIPNTKDYSWWTITPDSTKCNGDEVWVRYVSASGLISGWGYGNDNGVRPFCIFSSSIFESYSRLDKKCKKIEVPVLPQESIFHITSKSEIVEYKVESLIIRKNGIFIEICGNFDLGEEVSFSLNEIGKEIFLNKNDADNFLAMNNGR